MSPFQILCDAFHIFTGKTSCSAKSVCHTFKPMKWLILNIICCILHIFWKTSVPQSFIIIFQYSRFFYFNVTESVQRTEEEKLFGNSVVLMFFRKYVRCNAEYLKWIMAMVLIYNDMGLRFMRFLQWICETQHRIFKMETLRWFELMKNWLGTLIDRVFGLRLISNKFSDNMWDGALNIQNEPLLRLTCMLNWLCTMLDTVFERY